MRKPSIVGGALGALVVLSACSSTPDPTSGTVTVISSAAPTTIVTETVAPSSNSVSTTTVDSVPTRVVNLVAVDSAGRAINGFEVASPNPAGDIDCSYAAVSRATTTGRVYECGPSAQGADVCWAATSNTRLMCGDTPWSRQLRVWTITAGSLPTSGAPSSDPQPWGLELADGRQCRIRNGGAWGGRSDGMVGAYSCTGGNDVVLQSAKAAGAVNKSSSTWTVAVGPLGVGEAQFPPPTMVPVRTAYFAAAAG